MPRLRQHCLIIALTLLAFGGRANAQAAHSLDDVRTAAVNAVKAQLPSTRGTWFLSAGALDSRLRLAPCGTPLVAAAQATGNSSSRMTASVKCTTANQWTIYVPVIIEVELPVLVLQRALPRDARIGSADVQLQTRRVAGSPANFVNDIATLQNRHLKRPLTSGSPLTLDALAVDVMVKRGQQVTLLAKSGGIEIRAQGRAMADGGMNDRIRVQNVNSLKIVEGVVENAGTVVVDL